MADESVIADPEDVTKAINILQEQIDCLEKRLEDCKRLLFASEYSSQKPQNNFSVSLPSGKTFSNAEDLKSYIEQIAGSTDPQSVADKTEIDGRFASHIVTNLVPRLTPALPTWEEDKLSFFKLPFMTSTPFFKGECKNITTNETIQYFYNQIFEIPQTIASLKVQIEHVALNLTKKEATEELGLDKSITDFWKDLLTGEEARTETEAAMLKAINDAMDPEEVQEAFDLINDILNGSSERLRTLEQMWLLSRIAEIAETRSRYEHYDYTETGKPFSDAPGNVYPNLASHPKRDGCWIYPVHGEQIVNKLLGNEADKCFYFLTPDKLSYLVPKIQFYQELKEYVDDNGQQQDLGAPHNFKVPFFNHILQNDLSSLLESGAATGGGVGIDSFTWQYRGSNPVSATRDVTATLKLKAQNFKDIIKERDYVLNSGDSSPGQFTHTFKYADLAMRTSEKADQAPDLLHYKLKVIVGWGWNDAGVQHLEDCEKQAIKNSFLTFYLTIVDHSFNVNDDATIDFEINYRAYLGSAFSRPEANILTSEDLNDSRRERERIKDLLTDAKQTAETSEDKKCAEELQQQAKENFNKVMQIEKSVAYQTILHNLNFTQRVFFLDIPIPEIIQFATDPFREGTPLSKLSQSGGISPEVETTTEAVVNAGEGKESVLGNLRPTMDKNKFHINYFFLGDLIDAAIENMMTYEDPDVIEEFNRMRIVLGPLEVTNPKNGEIFNINLADVPISVNYYIEWFMDRVIKKQEVEWYLMAFIKDCIKSMVTNVLRSNDYFQSEAFSQRASFDMVYAVGVGTESGCPLRKLLDTQKAESPPPTDPAAPKTAPSNDRIDLDNIPPSITQPILGINTEYEEASPSEIYQYAIIYAADARPRIAQGISEDDFARGIPHLGIGLNVGPIKSISFKKTDQPYVREARFFRDGFDGLSQLREPYMVDITMYGNAKIFPGTMVYIDPTGLAPGASPQGIGRPGDKDSLAWTFGFGGYHLVTDVTHTIASGQFETNITAKFILRGNIDGEDLGSDSPSDIKVDPNSKAICNQAKTQLEKYVQDKIEESS